MNHLIPLISAALRVLVVATSERKLIRFLEFFAANIRNSHTRRATLLHGSAVWAH